MGKVLYFGNAYCTPCKMMKAVVARAMDEGADITYLDTDQYPSRVQEYGITSVPAFIKVDGRGDEIDRKVGAIAPAPFLEWVTR